DFHVTGVQTCALPISRIALQVLHYAVLDLATPAKDKPVHGKTFLPLWLSEIADTAYLRDPAQRRHRLVSPAWGSNADGIEGIAPALVITAERDRLRSEAATYARKLEERSEEHTSELQSREK